MLNLIGEVLVADRIRLENFSSDDLKNQALKVFEATLDESLVKEAKKLDDRIKDLRLRNKNMFILSTSFSDFYLRRNYTSIAREHVYDSQSMPFRFRLEEMRNIALLNKAIIRFLKTYKEDEIRLAEKDIQFVRNSVSTNYQFVGKAALRLDAIEDFFWIITGKSAELLPVAYKEPNYKTNVQTETSLHYLNERLKLAISTAEKVEIFI